MAVEPDRQRLDALEPGQGRQAAFGVLEQPGLERSGGDACVHDCPVPVDFVPVDFVLIDNQRTGVFSSRLAASRSRPLLLDAEGISRCAATPGNTACTSSGTQ